MKLADINNTELVLDEGLREKLLAGVAGAGITAAGLLGGQAMMNKGGGEPAPQAQQQKVDKSFWTTGTTVKPDGTIEISEIDFSPKVAQAGAMNKLAQYLGVDKLPPGIETKTIEKDGVYKTTVTLNKKNIGHAKKHAESMRGGSQSGKIHNDSDL